MATRRNKSRSALREWGKAILLALLLVWLIRFFGAQTVQISSHSMNATLTEGELYLVNKAAYGSRLPITLLSMPFSGSFFRNTKTWLSWIQLPYYRLPGYSTPKRGDIVVYNTPSADLPPDKGILQAKRIVGLPGDTVELRNGTVWVNGKKMADSEKVQYRYELKSSVELSPDFFSQAGVYEGGMVGNERNYEIYTDTATAALLALKPEIVSLRPLRAAIGQCDTLLYHPHGACWNVDNWGPVVLPRKGDRLPVKGEYETLILQHETLIETRDSIEIQNNYYFLLGDNRHNSVDSRHRGPIPEKFILGRMGWRIWKAGKPS